MLFISHLEHLVSYQGMQSGLPAFLVGELGSFKIFMKNDCLVKPDFSYFSNYKHQKTDQFWTEYDYILLSSYLLIKNKLYLDSGLFIKLKT